MAGMVASNPGAFAYKDRVVAFIDVLGFSELVRASGESPTARARLERLLAADKLFERFIGEFLEREGMSCFARRHPNASPS
jgi:hypothetical protein